MIKNIILISLISVSSAFAQSFTFNSPQTISSPVPSVDLSAEGHWFVNFNEDKWMKLGRIIYPNKEDASEDVEHNMLLVRSKMNVYVREALESGEYEIEDDGLDLDGVTEFHYSAVCFDDGQFCKIDARGQDGRLYTISLFPTLGNETQTAIDARDSIQSSLLVIEAAAQSGNFYK